MFKFFSCFFGQFLLTSSFFIKSMHVLRWLTFTDHSKFDAQISASNPHRPG